MSFKKKNTCIRKIMDVILFHCKLIIRHEKNIYILLKYVCFTKTDFWKENLSQKYCNKCFDYVLKYWRTFSLLLIWYHWSSTSSQTSNVAIFHEHTAYATSSAMSSGLMLSQPYLRCSPTFSSVFYLCQSSNHGKDASKMEKKTWIK